MSAPTRATGDGPTPGSPGTPGDVVLVMDTDAGPVVRNATVETGPGGLRCTALNDGAPVPWTEVASLTARPDGGRPELSVLDLHLGRRHHRILATPAQAALLLAAVPGDTRAPTGPDEGARPEPARAHPHGPRHARHRPPGTPRRRHPAPRHAAPRHPSSRWALAGARLRPAPGHAPRHRHARLTARRPEGPSRLRVSPVAASLTAFLLVVGGATVSTLLTGGAGAATPQTPAGGQGRSVSIMHRLAQDFAGQASVNALPAASAPPAPAPPSLANAPALRSHEIFGFAPYWALPQEQSFDVTGLTTLAYFSVGVNPNGTIAQSGPGWVGYQSQALADLVTRAHGAGDRVVLTASCFGQAALDTLAADPGAGTRIGTELAQLVAAKNLDGVNIDFEGEGSKDRAGLDRLMAGLSSVIRQTDPHWQVTMDTYASSAGDPAGFYDIAGLAPSVDAFFVMAYDMDNPAVPTPTAPLSGPGFTDVEAVQQYAAAVSPAKVILGVPFYGYDWPTAGPGLGDPATGPPTPLSYAQVLALEGHVYWDPATQTPWTSYQVGTQWHQAWFDDPTSLALKAQLVNSYHIAGMGVWALGMQGGDATMLAALRGGAPMVKNLPRGPGATATTTSTPPAATYSYAGVWDGTAVTLVPVDPTALAGQPTQAAGTLSSFSSDDPSVACLASASTGLVVSALTASPGLYAVSANPPADCAAGTWEFTVSTTPPTTVPGAPPTTTPTPTSTTSTTDPASTTTTMDPASSTSTTDAGH